MKKVAIIVVTYNRLSLLQECICSLRQQSYKDAQIVVVNNGSTDDTPIWLNKQNDIFVIDQENLGGAGGFYTGIKWACENGYEYSWVMDDDVIAYPDALQRLIDKTSYCKGFICSRVLDIDGDLCNVPLISKAKSPITGEEVWGNKLENSMIRVDVTSFVSVLIPSVVVYEVGLPYKEYFIWGDDTEYTQRISMSFESYISIDSKVIHKRALNGVLSLRTETNSNRIRNYFYSYRNRIHNRRKMIDKLKMIILSLWDILFLLFKLEFRKVLIILKALIAAITFNPDINFPKEFRCSQVHL